MFQAGAEQWDKQQQEMATYVLSIHRYRDPSTDIIQCYPRLPRRRLQRQACERRSPSPSPTNGVYLLPLRRERYHHITPSDCRISTNIPPGHWIQECPTNDNPEFDNRPRVKRTTGIPRSFLKTIEKPTSLTNDGLSDPTHQPSGVMVNADGDFVVAEPDKASWDQYQAKTKVSAAAQAAANTGSKDLQERGLECPIDKRLFVEPTKTPCCSTTYCNDCITNALIENDLVCPGCQTDGILIDNLLPDEDVIAKIKAYTEGKDSAKRDVAAAAATIAEKRSESPTTKPSDPSTPSKTDAKLSTQSNGTATPPATAAAAAAVSKKRPADTELENQRIPTGPAAMRKQQEAQQAQTQQHPLGFDPSAMMPSFPFIPPFPNGADPFSAGYMGMGFGMNANANMTMNMNMPMSMPMQMQMMGMPPGGGNMMVMNNGFNYNPAYAGTMQMGAQQPQRQSQQQQFYGNGASGGMQHQQRQMQMQMNGGNGAAGQFQGQMSTGNAARAGATSGDDDGGAYFRQPVNPHRHQARQRRMRPSDYQEL